jgi:hypothetical protein
MYSVLATCRFSSPCRYSGNGKGGLTCANQRRRRQATFLYGISPLTSIVDDPELHKHPRVYYLANLFSLAEPKALALKEFEDAREAVG